MRQSLCSSEPLRTGRLDSVPNTDDADLAALEKVTADLVDALTGINDSQGALPTPCTEWNLADLVDHVTGGNWYTVRVLAGDTSDTALAATMARFGYGPVSSSAAIRSATDQLEAFKSAEALNRSWHHVAGELAGRQILRLRVHDLIVHTWDINEARQPPASVPTKLAEWGLRELQDADSLMSKHFEIPDASGDRLPTDDPASAYLCAFGR